ncbi:hypothetical protein [Sphingobacterium thalpophilum]|uniref:hypothetical protein n=1 Tax=Sphingobacterium thalpophilum TaxID=259 RepID=UPI0024A7195C|nr:hypothetical protein [Sphingobacterium thalpophilum]
MTRKIIVNLVLALIVIPFLFLLKFSGNILSGNYQYYDAYYESLGTYINIVLIRPLAYPLVPILIATFILLPFQLLKDWYNKKKRKPMRFMMKLGLLILIAILWVSLSFPFVSIDGVVTNFGLLAGIIGICFLITVVLNIFVDRHTEENLLNQDI